MTAIITLDDGSDICASNMGLGGALERVAESISDTNPRLARWLFDVAQRGGGFMDFDLRALPPESRAAFWLGIARANEKYSQWDQEKSFSPTVGVIRLFYEKRGVQRDNMHEQIPQIDLDDLWLK